jgi:hypothetical protein
LFSIFFFEFFSKRTRPPKIENPQLTRHFEKFDYLQVYRKTIIQSRAPKDPKPNINQTYIECQRAYIPYPIFCCKTPGTELSVKIAIEWPLKILL